MKTYTKLYFILAFYLAGNVLFAQNTKVVDTPDGTVISNTGGSDIPHSASILDIRSTNKGVLFPRMSITNRDAIASPQAGLLIYNTSTNQYNYYDGAAWRVSNLGNQWGVNGNILYHTGKVAIDTTAMIDSTTFLTVRGNSTNGGLQGMYMDAKNSVSKPFYGYATNGISRAYHYYDWSTSKWNLHIGGTDRITVASTGYVGIGITSPLYRLHVNGSIYTNGNAYVIGNTYMYNNAEVSNDLNVNGNFDVDFDGNINRDAIVGRNLSVTGTSTLTGNVTTTGSITVGTNISAGNNIVVGNNATINGNGVVDGTLTVNNGKGVMYNVHGSSQLKYYTREATFTAILGGQDLSGEGSFGFASAGFTSPPAVTVGNIVSTGGTTGELFRVQLIIYDCTASSCKARLLNTSPNSVNYSITWNIICIGN